MSETQLKLETVTPMFLHGARTNRVELRPPPFKALFRYWWRTVQDCDTDLLRESEAKRFGSTKGKAPFSIRIPRTTNLNTKQYKPLPHRKDRLGFKRDSYNGGQSFNLYLITKDKSDIPIYKQIAKLGFLLGGVGNRSRRGFGSVREKDWNFKNICDLRDVILATLNAVAGQASRGFKIKGPTIKSTLTHFPKYPVIQFPKYPVIQCIYFGEPTCDVDSLLEKIGQATHDHKDDALGYARGQRRLASPIHVRIQKVGDEYVPVITQLTQLTQLHSTHLGPKQDKFINAIIR